MTFRVPTLEAHEDGGRSQGHQDCGGGRDGAHPFPHHWRRGADRLSNFSLFCPRRNCVHRDERQFRDALRGNPAVEVDLVTGAHLSGNRVVHQELVIVLLGGSMVIVCVFLRHMSSFVCGTHFHSISRTSNEIAEKTNTRNDMTQNVTNDEHALPPQL